MSAQTRPQGARSARSNTKVHPEDKSALRALNQLEMDRMRIKYPEIRQELLPPPGFKDNTANALTKSIIAFIRLNGGQAERISVTGRQIDKRQTYTDVMGHTRQIGQLKWIPTSGVRGSADISATIGGRSVKIEVKIGADRQRPDQKQYQQDIERAGGIYVIASTFGEFYRFYNERFR